MPYTPPSRRQSTDSNEPVSRNANGYGYLEHQDRPRRPTSRSAVYLSKHRRVPQKAEEQSDTKSPSFVVSSVPVDVGEKQDSTASQPIRLASRAIGGAFVAPSRATTSANNGKDRDGGAQLPVALEPSPESSEDDEYLLPMIRKKSGELVKPAPRYAPLTRSNSHPSLPSFSASEKPALLTDSSRRLQSILGNPKISKRVRFGDDLEHVRHFLQVDGPFTANARSPSVQHYEWVIRLSNFPTNTTERLAKPVRVERLWLSSDYRYLLGSVAVANLAFQKVIAARFTFDDWKTTSEVLAEYTAPTKDANDRYDRFMFWVRLSDQTNLEAKTLYLCVRYKVSGQEFWDNNNYTNFQIDFVKKAVPRQTNLRALPRPMFLRIYQYLPFSLPRAIRLLQLMPAAAGERLQCRLVVASLDERPKYEALSYEWGRHSQGAQNIHITCEGRSISITRNLAAALRVLRNESHPRTLWVDAICINQQSVAEKNCQVPLMKEIFELASQVIVWLGPRGLESEETFRKIAVSGQDYLDRFNARFGDGNTDFGEVVIDFLWHMCQRTTTDSKSRMLPRWSQSNEHSQR
jgi:hypothetical protein